MMPAVQAEDTSHAEVSVRKLWALGVSAVLVRLLLIVIYRLDSDEPQHLHVAWAWSRGLVQYRDVFDNHFPLLHLLFATFLRIAPESSAVFPLARLLMLPLALGCSLLLYAIAKPMVGKRTAILAAITLAVIPTWLLKSVEFRNDILWVFLWLTAIALIALRKSPFLGGIAVGLCILASVKGAPLLLAHVLALSFRRDLFSWRAAVRIAAGAALPVVLVLAFFGAKGALDEMLYCTLLFNGSVPVPIVRRIAGLVGFACLAPLLASRARRIARDPERHDLASHLQLFAWWFVLLNFCFWPVLTHRDFLPLAPLVSIALARSAMKRQWAPVALFAGCILYNLYFAELWQPRDAQRAEFVDAVTTVSAPGDYVFDLKGDSVFRRRAVRVIFDTVGVRLTRLGKLPDHGPEDLVARGCCVAIDDFSHIPPRTRAFLNAHFIDLGAVRVCGSVVRNGEFTVGVPQRYAVEARATKALRIDGIPYDGPRFLAAGRHTLTGAGDEPVTVLYWRAARKWLSRRESFASTAHP